MKPTVEKLSEDEMISLAAYVASLAPKTAMLLDSRNAGSICKSGDDAQYVGRVARGNLTTAQLDLRRHWVRVFPIRPWERFCAPMRSPGIIWAHEL